MQLTQICVSSFLKVSCQRIQVNFAAVGASSVLFPPYDTTMNMKRKLGDNGYHYEV
jgi:hypothetical protein